MIKKNTIRYILIFFINFFLFNNAFSFDYEIQTHAKRTILKSFPTENSVIKNQLLLDLAYT